MTHPSSRRRAVVTRMRLWGLVILVILEPVTSRSLTEDPENPSPELSSTNVSEPVTLSYGHLLPISSSTPSTIDKLKTVQRVTRTRVARQLSVIAPALQTMGCLPKFFCGMNSKKPSDSTSSMNDLAYLIRFAMVDEEDSAEGPQGKDGLSSDEESEEKTSDERFKQDQMFEHLAEEELIMDDPENLAHLWKDMKSKLKTKVKDGKMDDQVFEHLMKELDKEDKASFRLPSIFSGLKSLVRMGRSVTNGPRVDLEFPEGDFETGGGIQRKGKAFWETREFDEQMKLAARIGKTQRAEGDHCSTTFNLCPYTVKQMKNMVLGKSNFYPTSERPEWYMNNDGPKKPPTTRQPVIIITTRPPLLSTRRPNPMSHAIHMLNPLSQFGHRPNPHQTQGLGATGRPGPPQQGRPGGRPPQGHLGGPPQQGHAGGPPSQSRPGGPPKQGHPNGSPNQLAQGQVNKLRIPYKRPPQRTPRPQLLSSKEDDETPDKVPNYLEQPTNAHKPSATKKGTKLRQDYPDDGDDDDEDEELTSSEEEEKEDGNENSGSSTTAQPLKATENPPAPAAKPGTAGGKTPIGLPRPKYKIKQKPDKVQIPKLIYHPAKAKKGSSDESFEVSEENEDKQSDEAKGQESKEKDNAKDDNVSKPESTISSEEKQSPENKQSLEDKQSSEEKSNPDKKSHKGSDSNEYEYSSENPQQQKPIYNYFTKDSRPTSNDNPNNHRNPQYQNKNPLPHGSQGTHGSPTSKPGFLSSLFGKKPPLRPQSSNKRPYGFPPNKRPPPEERRDQESDETPPKPHGPPPPTVPPVYPNKMHVPPPNPPKGFKADGQLPDQEDDSRSKEQENSQQEISQESKEDPDNADDKQNSDTDEAASTESLERPTGQRVKDIFTKGSISNLGSKTDDDEEGNGIPPPPPLQSNWPKPDKIPSTLAPPTTPSTKAPEASSKEELISSDEDKEDDSTEGDPIDPTLEEQQSKEDDEPEEEDEITSSEEETLLKKRRKNKKKVEDDEADHADPPRNPNTFNEEISELGEVVGTFGGDDEHESGGHKQFDMFPAALPVPPAVTTISDLKNEIKIPLQPMPKVTPNKPPGLSLSSGYSSENQPPVPPGRNPNTKAGPGSGFSGVPSPGGIGNPGGLGNPGGVNGNSAAGGNRAPGGGNRAPGGGNRAPPGGNRAPGMGNRMPGQTTGQGTEETESSEEKLQTSSEELTNSSEEIGTKSSEEEAEDGKGGRTLLSRSKTSSQSTESSSKNSSISDSSQSNTPTETPIQGNNSTDITTPQIPIEWRRDSDLSDRNAENNSNDDNKRQKIFANLPPIYKWKLSPSQKLSGFKIPSTTPKPRRKLKKPPPTKDTFNSKPLSPQLMKYLRETYGNPAKLPPKAYAAIDLDRIHNRNSAPTEANTDRVKTTKNGKGQRPKWGYKPGDDDDPVHGGRRSSEEIQFDEFFHAGDEIGNGLSRRQGQVSGSSSTSKVKETNRVGGVTASTTTPSPDFYLPPIFGKLAFRLG